MEHNSRVASPATWPGVRLRVSRQYVTKRGITVRKLLICALALGGFAASAQAADLGDITSMKDPLPDTISSHGVTFYGTVDLGYAYQDHGYSYSPYFYTGMNYAPHGAENTTVTAAKGTIALPSQSQFTNNAMSQSMVGVKIEEGIGYGFTAIGKLESGFDPAGDSISDACKSVYEAAVYNKSNPNNAAPAANADGGRCGQFLNGQAYGGISNAMYGTLTGGRHNSLMTDGIGTYDPNHGSYAFSLIGFTGTPVAGGGSTEDSRWDNSIKYTYQYGPAHASVLYSNGGNGTSILGNAVGANVGATYKGFSLDGYYTQENGAVYLNSGNLTTNNIGFNYTISNNESFGVMGKYAFDFNGGFKDEMPAAKLTFFGGYVHVDITNPDHSQASYAGDQTLNGYGLIAPNVATGLAYLSDKILQTAWAGASYETGPWTFTGSYYIENQNTYNSGVANSPTKNLGGDLNWVSGVVDYKYNKHFDIYGGVTWTDYTGDWSKNANGTTVGTNEAYSVVTGVRVKF